jgi:hypothetical protein
MASYVAAASFGVVALQAILIASPVERLRARYLGYTPATTTPSSNVPQGISDRLRVHVAAHGGSVIFGYQLARLGSTVVLFCLAIAAMFLKRDFTWEDIALVSTIVSY